MSDKRYFLSCIFFFSFGHQNPDLDSLDAGSGSGFNESGFATLKTICVQKKKSKAANMFVYKPELEPEP
jgi:hypothetical protein